MRVLVAGATGVVGRPLVGRLVAAGHQVTGLTRSDRGAAALRGLGADAVLGDALDVTAVRAAVETARPEVIVNELTDLRALDARRPDYRGTNRVRREGTANLVEAATSSGVRRLVSQSIAFLYAPGAGPAGEDDPPWTDAPAPFGSAVDALLDLERLTLATAGLEGTVLRYGWFCGPGTAFAADGEMAGLVRRRRFPLVGPAHGVFSFIEVGDAAAATVAAVERPETGRFNIVDDHPAEVREWLPRFAVALGAGRPMRVPLWLARLVAGPMAVAIATGLRGASNVRAAVGLGWRPTRSWREVLGAAPPPGQTGERTLDRS